jgi:hypothetical protein
MDLTKIVSLSISLGIFFFVVWLIRERRLREKYALLWLFTSLFVILLTISRRVLESIALAIGIYYPPSLLFLIGVLFLLLVAIGQSVSLSHLSLCNHKLAQELALLRKTVADGIKSDQRDKKNDNS